MQIDLHQSTSRSEPFRSQVCVIGAGIAGLTLAHRLAKQGIDVALLEAGGLALEANAQSAVAETPLAGTPHLGTREGRFRILGGASLRWGGQLLSMPNELGSNWPIPAEALLPFYPDAEQILAVDNLSYRAADFFGAINTQPPTLLRQLPDLSARLSKWTPFVRRNLAETIGRDLLHHPRVTVYLHAQAAEMLLAATRTRIEAVLVRTLAGNTYRFQAQHFILAAGTVETSRLLLASCSVAPEGVGNVHDQVGRNFHDHLTLPAATFTGPARGAILNQFRPWIRGATLHSLKFEGSPALRAQLDLNSVLAHITLEEPETSGMAFLREFLTARQQRTLAHALGTHPFRLPAAALAAIQLGWSAKVDHRRFVSSKADVKLYLNAAQDSPSASRITLCPELDAFGIPLPVVDWRISSHEQHTLRSFALHLRQSLKSCGVSEGVHWSAELFNPDLPLSTLEDARHAMGGACMGNDSRTSVVDQDLKVHGLANLHIAGASTFPDGNAQLITLPLMCFALRLADHVKGLIQ